MERSPGLRLPLVGALSVRGTSRAEDRGSQSVASTRKTSLRRHKTQEAPTWRSLDQWAHTGNLQELQPYEKSWENRTNQKNAGKGAELPVCGGAQLEGQVEELQFQLLEKIVSGGFYQLKRLFLEHDPEERGRVTRESLLVILTTFLGRFISKGQFQHLLRRLRLSEKPIITFDSFYDHFKLEENTSPPDWLDPMKRKQKAGLKTAHEVHLELKNMANKRYFEFLKLFPRDSVNSSGLRSTLSRLGFLMADEEFKKLWQRYCREENGILGTEDLRRQLGMKNQQDISVDGGVLLSSLQKVSESREDHIGPHAGISSQVRNERALSLSIEKWLKEKFQEGSQAMMVEFLVCDPGRTHRVSRSDFLAVLERFKLHLTREKLGNFLARCGLEENSPDVDYVDFLQRLQTGWVRSRGRGVKGPYTPGSRLGGHRALSSASTTANIHQKLLNYLHSDFTALLQEFRKADKEKMDVISQQDFRAILERRFSLKVSDEEFAHLLESIPLDHSGAIRYRDFMAKFDNSEERLSLWGGNKTILTRCSRKPAATNQQASGKKNIAPERSVEQLGGVIKNLVKNNYEILEKNFNEMDSMNTRRLTQESLYLLLKKCGVQPEMSREEVRTLWRTLIQNQDCTVDYFHFVRHFGFSTKSSCFPNAKISPPVRGDGDCLLRSLKLNSDTKIIANFLQTKVKLHLEDLLIHFRELDPENSGCITTEEFLDLLQELSPDLTKHQCDTLAAKFSSGRNKVSYIKFLQLYQTGKYHIRKNEVKANQPEPKADPVLQGLNVMTSKLRQKLSPVDWRNLLNACQKMDTNGSGFLVLPEFRSVVKLCNFVLDEDDIYHIMSHYDPDLAGRIDYSRLISDHNKNKS